MKKYLSLSISLIVLVFFNQSSVLAQCPDNNANSGQVFAAPAVGVPTMVTINGGEYATINVMNGYTYQFSTCGGAAFDTEVTLYEDGTGVFLAENDDFCGLLSTVIWEATFDGVVRVLVDQFACLNSGGAATITASLSLNNITVDPGLGALINAVNQGSPCMTASNANFNGGAGVNSYHGIFSQNGTTLGSLTDGIFISNGSLAGDDLGLPNDPDMAALMGVGAGEAEDAVNLSFDFVPNGNAITFDLVFATDESTPANTFNDGGAVFISGPGFAGRQNVFFTDTNDPSFAVSDIPDDDGDAWDENTAVQNVTINGLTAGSTYNLEFVVADGSDQIISSALYIGPITVLTNGTACTLSAIPTMGEWGLIILALLVLSFGTVFMMRRQVAFAGTGTQSASASSGIPFDKVNFLKILAGVMLTLAVVFALSVFAFGYEMTNADVPGSLIAAPIAAYLLHLMFRKNK